MKFGAMVMALASEGHNNGGGAGGKVLLMATGAGTKSFLNRQTGRLQQ